MTTEFQPIDPRIPFYIPENWIQPTAGSGPGSFINFPTAQTALINFPGSILCSNFQSFAPSAGMNLFNNSTTGNIQFANANGYTGGIVINANNTTPVANQTIIGTSARPCVAPLLHTTEIYGTGAFASQVTMNGDFIVANGYGLYSNFVEQNTGGILTICGNNGVRLDIGTGATRTDVINIGTGMGVASLGALINVGSTVSGININARLQSGLQLNYSPTTYSGIDTYMGGYKEGTYNTAISMTLNTTEERILGSTTSLISTGVYILNVNTTMSTSVLNPYLTYAMYSKATAWTNGGLRGGLGTVNAYLSRVNRSPTTNVTDVFSLSITGLLVVSTKGYYAIVVGEANPALSQNITYVDTYMSLTRVG